MWRYKLKWPINTQTAGQYLAYLEPERKNMELRAPCVSISRTSREAQVSRAIQLSGSTSRVNRERHHWTSIINWVLTSLWVKNVWNMSIERCMLTHYKCSKSIIWIAIYRRQWNTLVHLNLQQSAKSRLPTPNTPGSICYENPYSWIISISEKYFDEALTWELH